MCRADAPSGRIQLGTRLRYHNVLLKRHMQPTSAIPIECLPTIGASTFPEREASHRTLVSSGRDCLCKTW